MAVRKAWKISLLALLASVVYCLPSSRNDVEIPQPGPSCSTFTCHSDGNCLSLEKVCDGFPDCEDRSDELNCPTISPRVCVDRITNCRFYDVSGNTCKNNLNFATKLCPKYCNMCLNHQFSNFTVRLTDEILGNQSGKLEVFLQGQWGTVCSRSFDNKAATAACRQLGFDTGIASSKRASTATSQPMWITAVSCTGKEDKLNDCYVKHEPGVCGLHEAVGIYCSSDTDRGKIRLVGSGLGNEGRLEVFLNGQWGTVCDDNFDSREATVACRQLGYSSGNILRRRTFTSYGFIRPTSTSPINGSVTANSTRNTTAAKSTIPIWLDDMRCTGKEKSLFACPNNGVGNHNCGHSEDVYVTCNHSTTALETTPYVKDIHVRGRKGEIASPKYGSSYRSNAHVTFHLDLDNKENTELRVGFMLETFDVEDCSSVCCDKVIIGGQEYCGQLHGQNIVVITSQSELKIEFKTDENNLGSHKGFHIYYRAFPLLELSGSATIVKCDQTVHDVSSGYIISPFYPGLAHPGYRCYHQLNFSSDVSTVRFEFLDYGLAYSYSGRSYRTYCNDGYDSKIVFPKMEPHCRYYEPPNFGGIVEDTTTDGRYKIESVFRRSPSVGYVIKFKAWPGLPSDEFRRPIVPLTVGPLAPSTSNLTHVVG